MAKTRAQENRAKRKEELRDKFKVVEYIRQLEEIATEYDQVSKAMDVAVTQKKKLTKKDAEQLQARHHQIEALKFKIEVMRHKQDLNFRRLKFVLPELRSVELTDPQGKNPLGELADAFKEALSGLSS